MQLLPEVVRSFWAELEKVAALTEGQKRYRRKNPNYFGGEKKVEVSEDELSEYRARLRAAGLSDTPLAPGAILSPSLAKTEKGFAVYTHRARSAWYPSPGAIPISKIKFIESTG